MLEEKFMRRTIDMIRELVHILQNPSVYPLSDDAIRYVESLIMLRHNELPL